MGKVIDAKEKFTSSKEKDDNKQVNDYEVNSATIAMKMLEELNSYFMPKGEDYEKVISNCIIISNDTINSCLC